MKPSYKRKNWRMGRSFGTWDVPFCGKCKRQLGLIAMEKKIEKCPMCGTPIYWDENR